MKKKLIKYFILGVFFVFLVNNVSGLVVDSVVMDSQGISLGEFTDIEIGLRNNGNEDVRDVSVFLDLENIPLAPYDSSSEFGIDEIREGRLKFANFKIIALNDAKSQIYKIPVKISYVEEGENVVQMKNSLISIKVNSEPILDAVIENTFLLKGQENDVVIKIINKGFSDVHFLEVGVGKSSKFDVISKSNVYVGDLDSDDFDSVEFKVFFEKDISNRIGFPVTLKYKDAFNNEGKKEVEVLLNVYSHERAEELGLVEKSKTSQIIAGVIVLIVLGFIYRWLRKRKRLKKRNLGEDKRF